MLRRNPLNVIADDHQAAQTASPQTPAEPTGIERRRHPRVSLAELETPPPAEPTGIERRRHPRVSLTETEQPPTASPVEERRRGDRRSEDAGPYSGPERRRGDRRSFDDVRSGLNWGAAPEHKNKFQVPANPLFRPARLILLAVAVSAGGLAAVLVAQSAPQQTAAAVVVETVAPVTGTKILVATQAIGIGQRLSDNAIAWQDWPTSALLPEYVTQDAAPDAITEMAGTVARFELFVGEPIRQDKLAHDAQGYLSAILQTGMRGVSVSVSAQSASGGFVVPNDHVDVVLTRPSATGQVSETILRNARVLAINARLGERGTTGAPADPDDPRAEIFVDHAIATLELDEAGTEVIINASNAGSLALVLRSMADYATTEDVATHQINQAIRITSPFWNQSN